MAASAVELEPWHAVNSGDGDIFFYIKFALDASVPRSDAEPAFVVLATDLLKVWEYTVSHERAPSWIKEQHSTLVVDDHMMPLQNLRAVLLGINTQQAPRIRPLDSLALLIEVPITSRVMFRLTCEPLAPADAASVLCEQMLLPALHMSALFAGHAHVDGWSATTASRAAEEFANGDFSRLEFSGAIAAVYQTFMSRRVGRGPLPRPASEHAGEPAGAEASTLEPAAVEPAAASNGSGANGGESTEAPSTKRHKLVIDRAPAKLPNRDRMPR